MSSADIEMETLSRAQAKPEYPITEPEQPSESLHDDDGVISSWAWTSAVLLLLIAMPLMLSPKLLLFLSEAGEERRASLTPLESFLAWNTGIMLSGVALALVFNIPSGVYEPTAMKGAPGHPLLEPLSATCVVISFVAYNTTSVGSLGFLLCLGSATIGLWGLWAILFSGSSNISRKTGADKRTSRFIFGNKAAASSQKKRWKKEVTSH